MNARALPLLLLATVRCGASTRATDGGSDARSSAECRWTQRDAIAVTPRGSPAFRLLDATSTGDGALIALRDSLAAPTDHLWLATVRNTTVAIDRVADVAASLAVEASLAFDPRTQEQWALFDGVADRCLFIHRPVDARSTETSFDPSALTMSFTMSGCRDVWRSANRLSFLSEEVRALWGTQQIELDDEGRFVAANRLPMTSAQPIDRTRRSALSSTAQVALSVIATQPAPQFELRAQTLDARAQPTGESARIATTAIAPTAPQVIATPSGMLAVWDNAVDTLPPVHSLAVRPLDARAQPTGEAVELSQYGMLSGVPHATERTGSVLVTARFLDGERKQRFLALDGQGRVVFGPLDLVLPSFGTGVVRSRIVGTTQGALVITEVNTQSTGSEIVAVPIECQ